MKLVYLNNTTRLNLPPDRVLEKAVGEMSGVVVLGYDKDGNEYFASSYADGGEILWLLEMCKKRLMEDKA